MSLKEKLFEELARLNEEVQEEKQRKAYLIEEILKSEKKIALLKELIELETGEKAA